MKDYMRPIALKLTFILFAVLFFARCEKEETETSHTEKNQLIYFQCDYRNSAWGYTHYGWIVDSAGNVFSYYSPVDWVYFDSLGTISDSAMLANLSATDTLCYQVTAHELSENIDLINNAFLGTCSEPELEMYDAGTARYYAFKYDSITKIYNSVLVKQVGDFRVDNSSKAAIQIYEWLETVNTYVKYRH